MNGYRNYTHSDPIADAYDQRMPHAPPQDALVDALASLAGAGPALELGIGAGRVALPLVARGVAVHGLDASERLVAQLRATPGGERIPVTLGSFADLADLPLPVSFALIYVTSSTFFALRSPEDQLRCFAGAARRLIAGGIFLMECNVPNPRHVARQIPRMTGGALDHAPLASPRHLQPVTDGARLAPAMERYAWPAELDLMARLAGMRLRERWGDWTRGPFTGAAYSHISLYERGA